MKYRLVMLMAALLFTWVFTAPVYASVEDDFANYAADVIVAQQKVKGNMTLLTAEMAKLAKQYPVDSAEWISYARRVEGDPNEMTRYLDRLNKALVKKGYQFPE